MTDITVGILAHVDAGKTTLSEALLYCGGVIGRPGRVDHRDTFLDTDRMERDRGITIYFKQAIFESGNLRVTLLDTPGHSDLSAEAERVLSVLDFAILVISAADGVQSHTRTLWKLLEEYSIPVFIFVNKMDRPDTGKNELLKEIQRELSAYAVDFSDTSDEGFYESIALCDEGLMETYLDTNTIEIPAISSAIRARSIFPVCFGSALRLTGTEEFMSMLSVFAMPPERSAKFGARVFKISRDGQGNRLTHMKITGGALRVRDTLNSEKVGRIRIYNGESYTEVQEAAAGAVCAVPGLTETHQGDGLGTEPSLAAPLLKPVLSYRIAYPNDADPLILYGQLKELEDEEPELHITWNEDAGKRSREIIAEIMGDVQTEVIIREVKDRYNTDIEFTEGSVKYRETIADTVEGVGHFEPLRHYAEVHLIISPAERGSGITASADCPEELLAKNWQRLILTHIMEKEHRGVLTGSPLTDVHISVASGKASTKHTEGGDFRQATYRAVRQGLMEAESILLEPYCEYTVTLPSEFTGRVMTDLDRIGAKQDDIYHHETEPVSVLTGRAPYATIRNYQRELNSQTRGQGRITLALCGYDKCHNSEDVVNATGYDPESDMRNPAHSVFCTHGAGYSVPWYQVKAMMHLPSALDPPTEAAPDALTQETNRDKLKMTADKLWISPDEVEAILNRAYNSNSAANKGSNRRKWKKSLVRDDLPAVTASDRGRSSADKSRLEKYLLVDGYNVIFTWEELAELVRINIDSAREKLLDILENYAGMNDVNIIAVFDAYRLENHPEELTEHGNINVIFTKTAQTADAYIEKFVHDNRGRYDISVVTSDRLEQIIIMGNDATLISSREFEAQVRLVNERIRGMLDAQPALRIRDRVDMSGFKPE